MSEFLEVRKDEYMICDDKAKLDLTWIFETLSKSYWANTRSKELILKTIENSHCFSLFHNDKQVGFARVITDYATFAYLCDLIIDDKYRGKGLGKWFTNTIISESKCGESSKWMLVTKDAQGLYKKYGFNTISNPDNIMMKVNQ